MEEEEGEPEGEKATTYLSVRPFLLSLLYSSHMQVDVREAHTHITHGGQGTHALTSKSDRSQLNLPHSHRAHLLRGGGGIENVLAGATDLIGPKKVHFFRGKVHYYFLGPQEIASWLSTPLSLSFPL